jgi:hypothetical protein
MQLLLLHVHLLLRCHSWPRCCGQQRCRQALVLLALFGRHSQLLIDYVTVADMPAVIGTVCLRVGWCWEGGIMCRGLAWFVSFSVGSAGPAGLGLIASHWGFWMEYRVWDL